MIRRLRRRHLRMVATVALLAAPLSLAGLWLRPAPAVVSSLPPAVAAAPAPAPPSAETIRLTGAAAERLRIARAGRRLVLTARGEIARPELLVYWGPGGLAGTDPLDRAAYLGVFRGEGGQAFELSAAQQAAGGELLLYSLGHREVVARAALDPRPAAAGGS